MNNNYKVILETIAGSHMYGTNTPESDNDYRGIAIQEVKDLMNPFHHFEQFIETKKEDRTIWNVDKFFKLAYDNNPNILEILYANDKTITKITEEGEFLLDNSRFFLSQEVRKTFTGYAISQINRIKTHRGYLLNPPKSKPQRKEFGLPESPLFGLEKINSIIFSPKESIKEEWIEYAEKERKYRSASDSYKKYQEWKTNRNPKRAEIEEKFGFDTKHASHLIRLLYEGQDILENETLEFPLPYADFLLDIREGVYKYEEILDLAEEEKVKLETMKSGLPNRPSEEKLLEIYYSLYGF